MGAEEFTGSVVEVAVWAIMIGGIVLCLRDPMQRRWVTWLGLYFPLLGQPGFVDNLLLCTSLFTVIEYAYRRLRHVPRLAKR